MVFQVGIEPDPAKRIRAKQGTLIRQHREFRRLTQKQLATLMDPPVTAQVVSQWETGVCSPRQHTQLALAQALDVPWSALFMLGSAS